MQFLKESEVREQDNLPSIDNESNQFEVSEYVDDIYQYYWVTEVILIVPVMSAPFYVMLSSLLPITLNMYLFLVVE